MKNTTKTARTRSRKFGGHCEACGKSICACKAYQYTDDSNGAISANSQYLCRDCYEKKYGVEIPTEVEVYKKRLKDKLRHYVIRLNDEKSKDIALGIMRLIEKTD